jgi:hypothetical protein
MQADADPVDFVKFGGTRNDFEDLFDNTKRLKGYEVDHLPSRVGDQLPGNHVPEVRFRVGNAFLKDTAKHCNFAGDDCWYVKSHPKIDSVSAAEGYQAGGQELTIAGWGLRGETLDDVEVLVDGVPCRVTSNTQEEIKCVTGAAEGLSNGGISQPGSPGLVYSVGDHQGEWTGNIDDRREPATWTKSLLTNWETNVNVLTKNSTLANGWFKAPATGRYRFYISCDDVCQLKINTDTPFDKSAPAEAALTEIARRVSWT